MVLSQTSFFGQGAILSLAKENSELRLWNISETSTPGGCQQLSLKSADGEKSSTYVVDVNWKHDCAVICDTKSNHMLCLQFSQSHRSGNLIISHVIQFSLAYPTYSINIVQQEDPEDQQHFLAYCMQSRAIHLFRVNPKEYLKNAVKQERQIEIPLPLPESPEIPSSELTSNTAKEMPMAEKKNVRKEKTVDVIQPADTLNEVSNISTKKGINSKTKDKNNDAAAFGKPMTFDANILKKLLQDQLQEIESNAALRAEKDTERQQLLLRVLSKSLNEIPESVETVMKELSSDLSRSMVQDQEFTGAIAASLREPLSSTMQTLLKSGIGIDEAKVSEAFSKNMNSISEEVSKRLRTSLIDSFEQTVEYSLVPAFKAACANMSDQVNKSWIKANTQMQREMMDIKRSQQEVSKKLGKIESLLEKLTSSSSSSKSGAGANVTARNNDESADHPSSSNAEAQIDYWISRKDYENAFLSALHSQVSSVVVSTCRKCESIDVFRQSPLPLSQKVLLSLFHTLSSDLAVDSVLKFTWIKNIVFSLNKDDQSIALHLPRVLENVRQCLLQNADMFQNPSHPAHDEYKVCLLVINSFRG